MRSKFLYILILSSFFALSQKNISIDPIDTPPVDQTIGIVRDIKSDMTVSLTGSLNYQVPIEVPPGINGVTPQVSLNYNSQNGVGIAGYGWNISGVSMISRTGKRKDIDGYNASISNTIWDNYALDGQRLIYKSGQIGSAQGAIFETENFSNVKISAIGSSSSTQSVSPDYFLVEYPDGSKAYYGLITGNTSNSRTVIDYAITYWENPQGVRISYEYQINGNRLYISKIKYGNVGQLSSINQINFVYSNRVKSESVYIGGILVKNQLILKQIKVYGFGDLEIRRYSITHKILSSYEEKIEKISETNSYNSTDKNPILFEYEECSSLSDYSLDGLSTGLTYSELGNNVLFRESGDFNGDGRIDLIINGKIFTITDDNDLSLIYNGTDSNAFYNIFNINTLDSNLKFSNNQYLAKIESVSTNSSVKFYSLNTTNGQLNLEFERNFPTNFNNSVTNDSPTYLKGDFNGDGLTDMFFQNRNKLSEFQFADLDRRISSNYTKNYTISYSDHYLSTIQGDYNGDGKTDIILTKDLPDNVTSIKILTLNNNLEFEELFSYSFIRSTFINLRIGDFNGDGKSDILDLQSSKILFSTGKSFVEENLPSTFGAKGEDGRNNNYIICDFNNDGKSDIISTRNFRDKVEVGTQVVPATYNYNGTVATWETIPVYGYNLKVGIDCYYRSGSEYAPWRETHSQYVTFNPIAGSRPYVTPIPFSINKNKNSDQIEILLFTERYEQGRKFLRFSNNASSGKLKRIKAIINNNGYKKQIEYSNIMNNNGVYTSNLLQENYSNIDVQYNAGLYVVSKIIENVSNEFYRQKIFKYHGLVYNTDGLGILGFRSSMRTNWFVNENEVISHITKFDISKRGAPVESFSVLGNSNPTLTLLSSDPYISRSLITYNNEDTAYVNPLLSNKVYKLYKSKAHSFDGLHNTSSVVETTYNNTNNPTQIVETIKKGVTTEQVTTTNFGYDSLTSPYMVDRVISKSSSISIITNPDTTTSEELYTYDVNLLKEIKKKGHNTIYITEKNDFDIYGNIIKKTLSAPGLADRISNFEYDSTHRFVIASIASDALRTEYVYNQSNGLLLTEVSPNYETTNYLYDSWGKKIKTTNYLGKEQNYVYENIGSGVKVTISGDEGSENIVISDPLGRKIREVSKNIDNSYSNVITNYDINDKPILKSQPFLGELEVGEIQSWSEMQYDVYGRLIKSNSLKSNEGEGKVTNYTYNGLTMVEFDGQKLKETTQNALGQIITLTESPGGTINYIYYANGNLKSTTTSGVTTAITQDGWGRKTELNDPSAGVYKYAYNNFGELLEEEVVGKGKTNYTLDEFGKVIAKTVVGVGGDNTNTTTVYTYEPTTRQISSSVFTDNTNSYTITKSYIYDEFNYNKLLQTVEERPSSYIFQKDFVYDEFGRPEKEHFYAKDLTTNKLIDKWVLHTYKNGYNFQIYNMTNSSTVSNLLWQTSTVDATGKLLTGLMGNGISIQNTYDLYGFPTEFKHDKGTTNVITQTTSFDPIYGNLTSRNNNLFGAWNETLSYDSADRLTGYKDVLGVQSQTYNNNGTIASNNIGNYAYNLAGKPYTNSTITPVDQTATSVVLNYYLNRKQNITYNLHKSPVSITEQNKENIDFEYNDNNSRSVMYYGNLSTNKNLRLMRKFYSADGSMEIKRNTSNSSNDFVVYIGGDGYSAPVILKSDGTTSNYFYLHRDYQETIIAVSNSAGVIVEKRLFDVWGSLIKYTNNSGVTIVPITTTGLFIDRGYTGHEHLLGVGLINMNGRIYDNKLHRFLQPDNNIQDPYNIQNYNRYGYVMNNPTKYTDPSGETFWAYFFSALFNSYASGVQASNGQLNPFNWNSNAWVNAGLGAISSVSTQIATNSFNSYIDNYNNKPEINNFGSENTVEDHYYAVGRDSKVMDSFNDSDYKMSPMTNEVSISLKQTNQIGYLFGCGSFTKNSIDDKFGFNDHITNSMMLMQGQINKGLKPEEVLSFYQASNYKISNHGTRELRGPVVNFGVETIKWMISEMKLGHPVVIGWIAKEIGAHQSAVTKINYSNDYSNFVVYLMNPSSYSAKNNNDSMRWGRDYLMDLNSVFHVFSIWR